MTDVHPLTMLASDPAEFRRSLILPSARGPAPFGEIMADFQRRDFQTIDESLRALAAGKLPARQRFYWERTKGASKDSDAAACLLWLLAFARRPLRIQVGAADRDQAGEVVKVARGILHLNPWLGQLIEVINWVIRSVGRDFTAEAEIIAADVHGSHGARPDFVLLNELSHIQQREFAENLLDNAEKIPMGMVLICSNAGFIPSWQWEFRESCRQGERWAFSAYSQPAPWLNSKGIEERRRVLTPARFNRLWYGQWVTEGDAISLANLERAVDPALRPLLEREPNDCYVCGVDLSLSRDHTGVTVLGVGQDRRLRLAHTRTWKPPRGGKIDLAAVEDHITELNRTFDFQKVLLDLYQAEHLAQRLRQRGVRADTVQFTASTLSTMASELVSGFNDGRFVFYPEPTLLNDLRQAVVIERSSGLRLEFPRNRESGHGDLATSFCLAVLAAKGMQPISFPQLHGLAFDAMVAEAERKWAGFYVELDHEAAERGIATEIFRL